MKEIKIEYDNESLMNFPLYNNEKKVFNVDEKYTIDDSNQETFKLCPAVTTILSETKSPMAKLILERWKRNMINELGEEGFEKYQQSKLLIQFSVLNALFVYLFVLKKFLQTYSQPERRFIKLFRSF